ncbi:hypothetical protein FO519_007952 [Halicephalobus sp. NKZ332]|nr:hypothetical protein FO519_007952 [Halicephalobus sp. NKZ332]
MKLIFLTLFVIFFTVIEAQVCCDGYYSSGPCINDMCPTGKMCTNGMCCACRDTCYDCYLYVAYCNNTYYANCMSGCQYTCGKCHY